MRRLGHPAREQGIGEARRRGLGACKLHTILSGTRHCHERNSSMTTGATVACWHTHERSSARPWPLQPRATRAMAAAGRIIFMNFDRPLGGDGQIYFGFAPTFSDFISASWQAWRPPYHRVVAVGRPYLIATRARIPAVRALCIVRFVRCGLFFEIDPARTHRTY